MYLLPCVTFALQVSRLGAVHAAGSGPGPASDGVGGGLYHGCERLPTRIIQLRRAAAWQLHYAVRRDAMLAGFGGVRQEQGWDAEAAGDNMQACFILPGAGNPAA